MSKIFENEEVGKEEIKEELLLKKKKGTKIFNWWSRKADSVAQ